MKDRKYLLKILKNYEEENLEVKEYVLNRAIDNFEKNLEEMTKSQKQFEKFNVTRNLPFNIRWK